MSSGVTVQDSCLDIFQELKLRKAYKYIIYRLSDDLSQVIIDKSSTDGTYDSFVECLPPNECRWALYDFEYEKPGEGVRNKICFYAWSPDTAKVKDKMLYASSKDALRKKLVGIATEIQACDFSEVAYESVLDKVSRSTC